MVVEVKPQRPEEYSESDVKKLLNRYNHAKAIKDLWLPTFEECYEYALPQNESFYTEQPGRRRTEKIFDETAVVGVQEFASRLQSRKVPNFARWADFTAGSVVPKESRESINNDLDEVKRFVEINRKYLNIKDENGYTPLMLSALYNQPETARYLLENPGTFVNFKENYNATALCVASIWGNTDVSEILIEYGADPTTPCFNPAAPIENACRANLSEEILSQYKEIAEYYDIEYDEGKIQEGRDKCLDFFEQQRLNS